jgi:fibronectin-binding autotransporter adhesin
MKRLNDAPLPNTACVPITLILVLSILGLLGFASSSLQAANRYWDPDLTASGNNSSTGAGLGGTGTWDNGATANWWDGASTDLVWQVSNTDDAFFWGTAGTVTLSATVKTAKSLTFKTNNYTVTSSTINMSGTGTITTDSGVTATIGTVLGGTVGITKSGAGTVVLTASNTFTPGITINGGVLSHNGESTSTVGGNSNTGPIPGSVIPGYITINGSSGVLRSTREVVASLFSTAERGSR